MSLSSIQLTISGILVNVYTEPRLRSSTCHVAVLFLLHNGWSSAKKVEWVVQFLLRSFVERAGDTVLQTEFVIVTFVRSLRVSIEQTCANILQDHRNHGTRLLSPSANNIWSKDEKHNEQHAYVL